MKLIKYFLLASIMLYANIVTSQNEVGGLKFKSFTYNSDERTSILLFKDNGVEISDGFELSFDISFDAVKNFGYIFRFLDNKYDFNLDLVFVPTLENDEYRLKLISNRELTSFNFVMTPDQVIRNHWSNFSIQLFPSSNRIKVKFSDKVLEFTNQNLTNKLSPYIVFGANMRGKKPSTDVPSFQIRNLSIKNNQKPLYFWKLDEEAGTTARDTVSGRLLEISNPIWLRHLHKKWRFHTKIRGSYKSSFVFDTIENNIYFIDSSNVTVFNLVNLESEFTKFPKTLFYRASVSCINYKTNELIVYPMNQRVLIKLNKNFDYKKFKIKSDLPHLWLYKTAYYYSNIYNSIVLIGGYEYLYYYNSIRYIDSTQNYTLNIINDKVPKNGFMYSMSVNRYKNGYLLFGGVGNEQGKQELGVFNYNILYYYDESNLTFTKLRTFDKLLVDNTVSSNIWYNKKANSFFALTFKNQPTKSNLVLSKYNIKTGDIQYLGDSIKFDFLDINSHIGFFYSKTTNEFIAIAPNLTADSIIYNIYTLNYPPIFNSKKTEFNASIFFIAISSSFATIIIFIVFFLRYKKRTKSNKQKDSEITINEKISIRNEHISPTFYKENYISLFGEIKFLDQKGNDLFQQLTPRLQQLFLIIIIKSINEGGIHTDELLKNMWPTLDKTQAKNNKGVSLAKLKTIISEWGNIKLDFKNSKYKFTFNESIKIDFAIFLNAIDVIINKGELTDDELNLITTILNQGDFLTNQELVSLDKERSIFEDNLELLIRVISAICKKNPLEGLKYIPLLKAINLHDSINEELLKLFIFIAKRNDKKNLAKQNYTNFAKKYYESYGEEYYQDFNEIWDKAE